VSSASDALASVGYSLISSLCFFQAWVNVGELWRTRNAIIIVKIIAWLVYSFGVAVLAMSVGLVRWLPWLQYSEIIFIIRLTATIAGIFGWAYILFRLREQWRLHHFFNPDDAD